MTSTLAADKCYILYPGLAIVSKYNGSGYRIVVSLQSLLRMRSFGRSLVPKITYDFPTNNFSTFVSGTHIHFVDLLVLWTNIRS